MTREAAFGMLFCLEMHSIDFVWTFGCMYYREFVVEQKFGFNNSTFVNFCIGQLLEGILMLLRNVIYTLIATTTMYYGINNFPEYLYVSVVLITNIVVFVDCFGVLQLFDCNTNFKNLETANPELFKAVKSATGNCNCKIRNYYIVDSSTDTKHSNAYVGGLFNKDCVISDTLIEDLKS